MRKRGLWGIGRGGLCAGGREGRGLWVNGVGGGECTVSQGGCICERRGLGCGHCVLQLVGYVTLIEYRNITFID